jgi:hypothetical protein
MDNASVKLPVYLKIAQILMGITLATRQPIDALYVFIAYLIVQFLDNNLFVPKIVASKIKRYYPRDICYATQDKSCNDQPVTFLKIKIATGYKIN